MSNRKPNHVLTDEDRAKAPEGRRKAHARRILLREYITALYEEKVAEHPDGTPVTGAEAMAIKAFKAALDGDWKAWELVRDTSGQKPVDKVVTADIPVEESAAELDEIFEKVKHEE